MTPNVDAFSVSLVVLTLVLVVLLFLCWVLRRSKDRNLTVIRVSTGRTRKLVITTKPDNAPPLLDQLLERMIVEGEESLDDEQHPAFPHGTLQMLPATLLQWFSPPPSPVPNLGHRGSRASRSSTSGTSRRAATDDDDDDDDV